MISDIFERKKMGINVQLEGFSWCSLFISIGVSVFKLDFAETVNSDEDQEKNGDISWKLIKKDIILEIVRNDVFQL